MAKIPYVNITVNPASLEKLRLPKRKEVKVNDPIRYPDVVEPIENEFMKDYSKMLNVMKKMLSVELMRQVKSE